MKPKILHMEKCIASLGTEYKNYDDIKQFIQDQEEYFQFNGKSAASTEVKNVISKFIVTAFNKGLINEIEKDSLFNFTDSVFTSAVTKNEDTTRPVDVLNDFVRLKQANKLDSFELIKNYNLDAIASCIDIIFDFYSYCLSDEVIKSIFERLVAYSTAYVFTRDASLFLKAKNISEFLEKIGVITGEQSITLINNLGKEGADISREAWDIYRNRQE